VPVRVLVRSDSFLLFVYPEKRPFAGSVCHHKNNFGSENVMSHHVIFCLIDSNIDNNVLTIRYEYLILSLLSRVSLLGWSRIFKNVQMRDNLHTIQLVEQIDSGKTR